MMIRKESEFSVTEFQRREEVQFGDLRLVVAKPEDVLIAKLEWAKTGESERQIRDAAGIIEIQGPALDREYVEKWVAALDLEDQWRRARTEAS